MTGFWTYDNYHILFAIPTAVAVLTRPCRRGQFVLDTLRKIRIFFFSLRFYFDKFIMFYTYVVFYSRRAVGTF